MGDCPPLKKAISAAKSPGAWDLARPIRPLDWPERWYPTAIGPVILGRRTGLRSAHGRSNMVKHATLLIVLLTSSATAAANDNLLIHGDFEQGLSGWNELWTRTPDGKAALDAALQHGGRPAL